jgi:pimeloyl-ACP methyl ester carboxylesterase
MQRLLFGLVGLFVIAGCGPARSQLPAYHGDPQVRGSVVSVEHVGAHSAIEIRALLWVAKVPAQVSKSVDLYRITYWSRTNGKPVLVSGLMSLPDRGPPKGTVLWMHGTNYDRKGSVSHPSTEEGVLLSGVFAGGGYLFVAPDLLGLGVSKAPQAYLYNPSTIDVTLDFLRAAQIVSKDLGRPWNPNLYVAGFSQGGHSAAVIARELERLDDPRWRLKAAAGIEGAYNLADVSMPVAMGGSSSGHPVYLTLLALSYATYYGQPLDSVFNPPSAARARTLFDGDHGDQIQGHMPANPRDLFTPEFLQAYDHKQPNWFTDAERANEAYMWAPKAPFRAYYGDKDVDVSPDDAKGFVSEARRRGGDAEAVPVGPYDHTESAFHAVPMVRRWFDTLSASPAP